MNNVSRTLYIPLYGKAYVSRKGLFLQDEMAEAICRQENVTFRGRAGSKYLAYYMGIRASVFDAWLRERMAEMPDAVVLHIGCGLDSRVKRLNGMHREWYDVDFADVIRERKRHFAEDGGYRMLAGDVREKEWLGSIAPGRRAIVVMEGVSMYMTRQECSAFTDGLCAHFSQVVLLTDCYTVFAARMSKYKNPVNAVGVTQLHGIDCPEDMNNGPFVFACEHDMTPQRFIDQLRGAERWIFRHLYAGNFAKRLYRLYEYRKA